MSRSKKPPTPSALDGYRRLNRVRKQNAAASMSDTLPVIEADSGIDTPAKSRPSRRHQIIGAGRLFAAVLVILIIVGTSIGLAQSSNSSSKSEVFKAERVDSRKPQEPAETKSVDSKAAHANTKISQMQLQTQPAQPKTQPLLQPQPKPVGDLPFTGDRSALVLPLAAALTVLLGMMLQIAGTPLPARRN